MTRNDIDSGSPAGAAGPLSGTVTRNGRLTRGGFLIVAGLATLFLLGAAVRWPAIGGDVTTAMMGTRAVGTIVGPYLDAPAGGPDGAYLATVEFIVAGRGPVRVTRQLVASRGADGVGGGSRLRSDQPVSVAYRAEAPERAVLISAHERWAAIWTIPVGLTLLGLAWRFRPRV